MLKDLAIKEALLTNHNNPGYDLVELLGIVMHWTANKNKGSNAMANRNYFNDTDVSASAHYCVDDHGIVRCIKDNKVAWNCGALTYTAIGKTMEKVINGKYYSPNFFTIGIEMCVNSDGDWDKTYANSVMLVACLLIEHKMTISKLYRHYDITGKVCPAMMIDDKSWTKFKNDVAAKMKELTTPPVVVPTPAPVAEMYRVRKTWADAAGQIGAYTILANAKAEVDKRKGQGYKVYNSKGVAVYP